MAIRNREERTLLQDNEWGQCRRPVHEPDSHVRELNKINPFDYLTELLRRPAEITMRPAEWMLLNYRTTLARNAIPTAA